MTVKLVREEIKKGRTEAYTIPAGYVGEEIMNTAGPTALGGPAVNITSIILTPGHWEIQSVCQFVKTSGSSLFASLAISENSADYVGSIPGYTQLTAYVPNGWYSTITIPPYRIFVSATTT